ncbi:MAG TPA: type 4a pilus biogenesis protein PilO [Patescibacteria group bacterium]|nr:type 4a pilus biogenesis protein PilO [Patescibacteria group bacterium]
MAKFNLRTSIKHLQIDKANSRIVIVSAATVAVVVFSIVACVSLGKEMAYKNKVINLRNKANKQLVANLSSVNTLVTSYQTFENSSESVIGTADKNSKIVLDALPSKYDFPALATSLEAIITSSGSKISSITGTDNEATATQDSINPQPIEMPFQISATGSFTSAQTLILDLELSIRPIQISSLTLTGSDLNLQVSVMAKTYYQPEKQLGIQQNVVSGGSSKAKTTVSSPGATK